MKRFGVWLEEHPVANWAFFTGCLFMGMLIPNLIKSDLTSRDAWACLFAALGTGTLGMLLRVAIVRGRG
jgi:hypothetical protein